MQHHRQQRREGEATDAHGDGQGQKTGQRYDDGAGSMSVGNLHRWIVGAVMVMAEVPCCRPWCPVTGDSPGCHTAGTVFGSKRSDDMSVADIRPDALEIRHATMGT